MHRIWLLTLQLVSAIAVAAPDEGMLGKARGYPVQPYGPAFTFFAEEYKVGTFSHLDASFWPRSVRAPAVPRRLEPGAPLPAFTYTYANQAYTVEDFLARQRITGLIVVKDGAVRLERYQYERRPDMRMASFSMALPRKPTRQYRASVAS